MIAAHRRHIDKLAAKHGAEIVPVRDWKMSTANLDGLTSRVWIGAATDSDLPVAYIAALHEIGHLEHDHLKRHKWTKSHVVEAEAQAWRWVLDHIDFDLGEYEKDAIRSSLYSYTGKPYYRPTEPLSDMATALLTRFDLAIPPMRGEEAPW